MISRLRQLLRPAVGRWGERVAARFLVRRGLVLIARNFQTGAGEIDLIVKDGDVLVFVEVKTSLNEYEVTGLERIGGRKQHRIARAAAAYIKRVRPETDSFRLDAVVVRYSRSRLGFRRVEDVRWVPAFRELRW